MTKGPTVVSIISVPWLSLEKKDLDTQREEKKPMFFDFLTSEERIKISEQAMSGSYEVLDHLGGSGKDSQWGKRGVGCEVIGDRQRMLDHVRHKQKRKLEEVVDRLPIWC